MVAMDMTILVLFISLLGTIQQSVTQDVEIRGPNEAQAELDGGTGSTGGGQSRTIYSQRHLSPHRMMHFGKRPATGQAPSINTWQGFHDLVPPSMLSTALAPTQSRQVSSQQRRQQDFVNYPFQLSIELENGQILKTVPEDFSLQATPALQSYQIPINTRNLLYNLADNSPANDDDDAATKRAQQFLRQLIGQRQQSQSSGGGQKLSKLLDNEQSAKLFNNDDGDFSSEQPQGTNNNQQQEPNAINISTRSMNSLSRANTLSLPKAYVSTLWYGRQGSAAVPSLGVYNKKAEPKENFFMHFGRK